MQVAKGPYKCVPRQLRMTCEPRPSANTPRFCRLTVNQTRTERALPPGVTRVAERLRGSPRTRARQPRGAFRRGALTTDLQLTSAHWLVALAKSSSKRAAPARPEVLATATQATSGHALGA